MNKRDRLIGVLLILSVLFFQYLWLLLSVLLLVILGILIFDTRYDRYALVMVVLVLSLCFTRPIWYPRNRCYLH